LRSIDIYSKITREQVDLLLLACGLHNITGGTWLRSDEILDYAPEGCGPLILKQLVRMGLVEVTPRGLTKYRVTEQGLAIGSKVARRYDETNTDKRYSERKDLRRQL
jgi:hypothetical protein